MYDLSKSTNVDTTYDSVVIPVMLEDIAGGRSLDVTGVTEKTIKAGHVIIEEIATKVHKPLAVSGGNYAELPSGHTYKGILYVTIPTEKPAASIVVRGTVNKVAAVEGAGLPAYPSGAVDALSLIRFIEA